MRLGQKAVEAATCAVDRTRGTAVPTSLRPFQQNACGIARRRCCQPFLRIRTNVILREPEDIDEEVRLR